MAKIEDLIFKVDRFFLQTRINYCSTVNCANRKQMEFECNLKEIEVKEGKCASLIVAKRSDIIPSKPWPRD